MKNELFYGNILGIKEEMLCECSEKAMGQNPQE